MKPHWSTKLYALDACEDAVIWARTQPTYAAAWANCKRGDWMFWLAGKLSGPPESEGRKRLVLAACDCAEPSLTHIKDDWLRAVAEATLETSRAWACDANTIMLVREARSVCWSAAATAAAYAAELTRGRDTTAAAYAATAAAYAATTTATAAASARVLAQCADIAREWYPVGPELL